MLPVVDAQSVPFDQIDHLPSLKRKELRSLEVLSFYPRIHVVGFN